MAFAFQHECLPQFVPSVERVSDHFFDQQSDLRILTRKTVQHRIDRFAVRFRIVIPVDLVGDDPAFGKIFQCSGVDVINTVVERNEVCAADACVVFHICVQERQNFFALVLLQVLNVFKHQAFHVGLHINAVFVVMQYVVDLYDVVFADQKLSETVMQERLSFEEHRKLERIVTKDCINFLFIQRFLHHVLVDDPDRITCFFLAVSC